MGPPDTEQLAVLHHRRLRIHGRPAQNRWISRLILGARQAQTLFSVCRCQARDQQAALSSCVRNRLLCRRTCNPMAARNKEQSVCQSRCQANHFRSRDTTRGKGAPCCRSAREREPHGAKAGSALTKWKLYKHWQDRQEMAVDRI